MPPSRGPYRFGDFAFHPDSGELASAGGVTRLQPQVAALLSVLIEHAGAVVSRTELQAALWPQTTVEFDDGLNSCIRQLRIALGDDANAPRFVETLAKRGYRFLPSVTTEAPTWSKRRRRWIVATTVALALTAGAAVLARGRGGGAEIVLAVLPFAADTTDPLMASYQRRMTDQIVADARAEQAWKTRTGSSAGATHLLSGRLTRQGNSVRIFVQLVLARDRRHLWADDILDSYAFSGNSTLTADRIEKSVARVLGIRP